MCCCGQPVINGQPGFKWQPGDHPSVYPAMPPELVESDVLIADEPGRCGGIDCHSHHYRLVAYGSCWSLLVRHGGGDERIRLSRTEWLKQAIAASDSNARYWLFHTIYSAYRNGVETGGEVIAAKWRKAAAEKRIKTRRVRGTDSVKVWIETKIL